MPVNCHQAAIYSLTAALTYAFYTIRITSGGVMRILVTGGAGFVGSNLALFFKRDRPDATVVAFDNLRRRGSELALPRLRAAGVEFRHGDVRNAEDLAEAGDFDLMIECSAEPS